MEQRLPERVGLKESLWGETGTYWPPQYTPGGATPVSDVAATYRELDCFEHYIISYQ